MVDNEVSKTKHTIWPHGVNSLWSLQTGLNKDNYMLVVPSDSVC